MQWHPFAEKTLPFGASTTRGVVVFRLRVQRSADRRETFEKLLSRHTFSISRLSSPPILQGLPQ
jgi:hypothetical protein